MYLAWQKYLPLYFLILASFRVEVFGGTHPSPDKDQSINLALRKAADELLRISGDLTSRIPAIQNPVANTYRIYLHREFEYDSLPQILNGSLEQLGIHDTYSVAVRSCENDILELGFHKLQITEDSIAPCSGREAPEGCHYIEVTFFPDIENGSSFPATWIFLFLGLIVSVGAFWKLRKNGFTGTPATGEEWIKFGNSRLNFKGQVLEVNGERHKLTYREAKLLRLFVQHENEVLQREMIMEQVWEDEGVQVSRSVDMFVSRLRKKLTHDPVVNIIAVHGVGYRMEINN